MVWSNHPYHVNAFTRTVSVLIGMLFTPSLVKKFNSNGLRWEIFLILYISRFRDLSFEFLWSFVNQPISAFSFNEYAIIQIIVPLLITFSTLSFESCWKISNLRLNWKLTFPKRTLCTLGFLIQEGDRLFIFWFFPTPSHLIKTPTFINFSKRCQKPTFISMHKEHICSCLKRCHCIVFMFWSDGSKRYHCIAFLFWV